MFDLKQEKSIILGIGNLKLSDTEYTFGKSKTIEKIEYSSIFPWDDDYKIYRNLLTLLCVGDAKCAVKIKKEQEYLYYCYGANRTSSYAQNISLGIVDENREYSYFLREFFASIYEEEPKLTRRDIICIKNWQNRNIKLDSVIDINQSKDILLNEKVLEYWAYLEPKLPLFQSAFAKERLDNLCRIKKR